MEWDKIIPGCIVDHDIPTLSCFPAVFLNFITAALAFSGVVVVFLLLWAGIKYITSGGDPKQAGEAQQIITYAIIGLIVILLSFFIVNLLGEVLHLPCITSFGFSNCPST